MCSWKESHDTEYLGSMRDRGKVLRMSDWTRYIKEGLSRRAVTARCEIYEIYERLAAIAKSRKSRSQQGLRDSKRVSGCAARHARLHSGWFASSPPVVRPSPSMAGTQPVSAHRSLLRSFHPCLVSTILPSACREGHRKAP